ncbi:hypothetical protein RUMHYD_02390 [Blautia hydrogenotrophica DSM 10507]|uniref:Uncharacterized protein n=1 Tax=Blautia hydrogenotrophica (strain DSM 10507 / JCM 14656 / S5a33) TaxID=476272 RepID=C0CNF2_BLAHS|nr:hypothetical protein RUMHYD_02390 [Blautia hydrogenotrophica DSM 10507]
MFSIDRNPFFERYSYHTMNLGGCQRQYGGLGLDGLVLSEYNKKRIFHENRI